MPVLADLLVKLSADSAELRTEIGKARTELTGFARTTAEAAQTIKNLFAYEVIKEAAVAFGDFLKQGAEAAERLVIMSQKAGVTAEEMSRLSFAAKMVGSDGETMVGLLVRLSKNMEEAAGGGGKAAGAFLALGINVRDSETGALRPSVEVMKDVADSFAGMEDGAGKTALAVAIFGRAGADMIPLLNRGRQGIDELESESDRLAKTMRQEVVEGAAEFEDGLKKLHGGATILAATIAADLAGSFTKLIDVWAETGDKAKGMTTIAEGVGSALRGVAWLAFHVAEGFETLGIKFGAVSAAAALAAKGNFSEAVVAFNLGREDVTATKQKWAARREALWEKPQAGPTSPHGFRPGDDDYDADMAGNFLPLGTKTVAPTGWSKREKEVDEEEKALQRVQQALLRYREELATVGQTKGEKLLWDIASGKLAADLEKAGPAAAGLRAELQAVAGQLDAIAKSERVSDALKKLDDAAVRLRAEVAAKAGATTYDLTAERLRTGDLAPELRTVAAGDPLAAARARDALLAAATAKDEADGVKGLQAELDKLRDATARVAIETSAGRTAFELSHGTLKRYADLAGGEASEKVRQLSQSILDEARAFDAAKRQADAIREARAAYEEARSPLDKYTEGMRLLSSAEATAALTQEQIVTGQRKLRENFEREGGVMTKFTQGVSQNVRAAFSEDIFDGFTKGLARTRDAFLDTIRRMAAQALAANLMNALGLGPDGGAVTKGLNAIGEMLGVGGSKATVGGQTPGKITGNIVSGTGSFTSLTAPTATVGALQVGTIQAGVLEGGAGGEALQSGIGSFLDFGGGESLSWTDIPLTEGGGEGFGLAGFAGGGDVRGRRPILIGERGPEIFVPSSAGRILPNEAVSRAGRPSRTEMRVSIDDRAMRMTMSDWLERELARVASVR